MEGHLIVSAAIIADDLVAARRVFALRGFLRTALGTPLGRHHIALIKKLLIFFAKNKNFAALNTRDLDVRHYLPPFSGGL